MFIFAIGATDQKTYKYFMNDPADATTGTYKLLF